MGEQFSADISGLRSRVPKFDQIAAEVAAVVDQLRDAVAGADEPWGHDDVGRAFGELFGPEEQQTLSELDSLTEVVHQAGSDLRDLADNVEDLDFASSRQIDEANQENRTGPISLARGTPVASVPAPEDTSMTSDQVSTPAPAVWPDARVPAGETPVSTSSDESPLGTQQGHPDQGGQSGKGAPTSGIETPGGAGHNTTPDNVGGAPTSERARHAGTPWSSPPPERSTGKNAAASPSPSAGGGTPWSNAAREGGPPRVTAPASSRSDTPPPSQSRPPAQPGKAAKAQSQPATKRSDEQVESIAARLARELAERHGVRAFGFETAGVPSQVLTAVVTAVDDVLPRYPEIALRAIGIDTLPEGELTRLTWDEALAPDEGCDKRDATDRTAAVAEPPANEPVGRSARIVLAAHAATDPKELARSISAGDRAGILAPGCAERPVYSAIVRELGNALDSVGGFRARAQAQRALVASHLDRWLPTERTSLGATVAAFKEWRSQLPGRSFHHGRFEPAAALEEAFTAVVLDPVDPPEPARVLHRLLVSASRSGSP